MICICHIENIIYLLCAASNMGRVLCATAFVLYYLFYTVFSGTYSLHIEPPFSAASALFQMSSFIIFCTHCHSLLL